MPKVSIIVPCYNLDRYINAAIDSACAQTLIDWEMVVVDDGSTDASAAITQARAANEPRLHFVTKANGGVSSARNAGYRWLKSDGRASGDYLLFLDGDDVMEPNMLEVMSKYLDEHPEVGLVCCRPRLIGDNGELLQAAPETIGWSPRYSPTLLWLRRIPDNVARTPFASLFAPATIIPSVSLVRQSVYADTPGFDESFGHLFEDLDLFLQVALRCDVHFLSDPLLRYRQHPSQSTANTDKMRAQEKKMYKKWWAALQEMPPEHARLVRAGFKFREGRMKPMGGFTVAQRHLQRGEWVVAARFGGGALRHYLQRLFSRTISEPV